MSWKPQTGQKIERLYAWIAEEPDGGEGVMKRQRHHDMATLTRMIVGALCAHASTLKTDNASWRSDYLLLAEAFESGEAQIVFRHRHDCQTDKTGLIDTCRTCGEERA